jgi:formylglycine-generating enzyme required for sulfatase activity/uncharacterized caspase-like protein
VNERGGDVQGDRAMWFALSTHGAVALECPNWTVSSSSFVEGNVGFTRIIAVAWLMLLCAVAPGLAEKRVALVVGNAAYRHADTLANPVNDARGVRDALKQLGFDVTYGEDLDQTGLRQAIGQFARTVNGAAVAIVYFAGHGATFGDTPYVVPVDAAFSSLEQVPYELVPVETLIGELRRAEGVRIAILDACRDNAAERDLKRRAAAVRGGEVTRGLGPIKSPSGLIIAYATQYLSTAADNADGASAGGLFSWGNSFTRHSPFTAALLNNIATPGLDITDMLRKVGREVDAATRGRQRPEISISMYEQYALVPAAPSPAASSPAAAAPAVGSKPNAPAALPEAAPAVTAAVAAPAAPLPAERKPVQTVPVRPDAGTKDPAADALVPGAAKPAAGQQTAAVAPPVKPAVPEAEPCSGPVTASFATRCAAPLTAAQERGLKPKDAFRECDKCPEMVMVPAGTFAMGAPGDEEGAGSSEVPQHPVVLGQAFAVGRFAVTFDEWDACVADGGCNRYRPDDRGWGRGLRPVINVSWNDAKGYVAWLSRKTGKPYRLLSEAEREYVTRAGTTTPFWWGAAISTERANYDGRQHYKDGPRGEFRQRTVPVNSFEPNPWGLYQVHGNVYEWTEDCFHFSYNGAPSDGSPWTTGDCSRRVGRGSSWYDSASDLRAAHRGSSPSNDRSNSVGFRVARSLLTAIAPK